ncbi:T-cell surface glycoprotein CD8 alpha chain [Melanerpes formicivorus]|uniref:T-cell surface glycoprotein CD8 alpha chain n=1 Tax=Melanerpes formicivorus TaxID=211600 RepID=UPI00358F428E
MARTPLLLLLLGLGLCCPGIHGQENSIRIRYGGSQAGRLQAGQRLELECVPERRDTGMLWIRQDEEEALHFIAYISYMNKVTFEGNQRTSPRFEARKVSSSYQLVVRDFQQRDEGRYFCLVNSNQMLYFSSGLPAFFPVTTTTPPPTTQHGTTTQDSCLRTTDPGTSREELSLFCDIFVWVPLAGACLLLAIALTVTLAVCQQTRSRRCRCKRPAPGKPKVKPGTPSRHA